VENARGIRIATKKIDLTLKLLIRRPIVIALQEGDILAITHGDRVKKIGVSPNVPRAANNSDAVPVFTFKLPQYGGRRIGRTVFANHDFVFEIDVLPEYASDSLLNVVFVIICDHTNADFHHHTPRVLNFSIDLTDRILIDH